MVKSGRSGQSSGIKIAKVVKIARRKSAPSASIPVPPSDVTLAPIAIGNTIKGFRSKVVTKNDGCTVIGRDFCFAPISTVGTVTNWCLVGGAPLTPAAFVDSTLRQYLQMYNLFRFRRIIAHFITSSPTTANGDVMFYYSKNRESPFLNQTSSNLLPFVISDPNTILGPQWKNHSAEFDVSHDWKSTDYGIDVPVSAYADGELFLLSKTSTTDSPGYVLFDYIIEFREHSTIPRLLTLPLTKVLWNQLQVLAPGGVYTAGVAFTLTVGGTNLSGSPSAMPSGAVDGDIYKVIFDKSNSTLGTNSSALTTVNINNSLGQAVTQMSLVDGTTFYAVYVGSLGGFTFFPSVVAAVAGDRPFTASATVTTTLSGFMIWISYVTSVAGIVNQPNF